MISNVETGVLLNILIETVILFFRILWIKQHLFEIEIYATNVFNFL